MDGATAPEVEGLWAEFAEMEELKEQSSRDMADLTSTLDEKDGVIY